jgi:spore coat protein CotH
LQQTPVDEAAFEREIDPIFPLDDYIERMVWIAITRNGDAVAQNFYLYNAPQADRDRWYQIPWDSDLCMGSSWRDRDAVVPPGVSLMLDGGNYFGRKLTQVSRLRERYAGRFRQVLDDVLTEDVMLHHLERHAARVRHDLEEDQHRWQRNITPDEAFDVIRDFMRERPALLREGLDSFAPEEHGAPPG